MTKEYILIFDKEFKKKFRKLDNSIQIEGEKKIEKLKISPKEIGKPLKYISNLFELHIRMYRIFYVVRDNQVRVLLLTVEHKDKTDKYLRRLTSDKIKQLFDENP